MGTQLAQPDLDLLAYAEVQGLDEVAAQVNIIRRGCLLYTSDAADEL